MSAVRFSLGLGTFTARREEDETPREAVARSLGRRLGAHSVRLNHDSRAMDGSFENFQYTALARFNQRTGGSRVIESGTVTIFRDEHQSHHTLGENS